MKGKISELTRDEEERALTLHEKSIVVNCLDVTLDEHFTEGYVVKLGKAGITAARTTVFPLEADFRKAIEGVPQGAGMSGGGTTQRPAGARAACLVDSSRLKRLLMHIYPNIIHRFFHLLFGWPKPTANSYPLAHGAFKEPHRHTGSF